MGGGISEYGDKYGGASKFGWGGFVGIIVSRSLLVMWNKASCTH